MTGADQPVAKTIIRELAAHGSAAIYACTATSEDHEALSKAISAEYPSTKVIAYPSRLANEEDTLTLIDDVLNAWGRYDNDLSVEQS